MENKVTVITDDNFRPYYKVELYIDLEHMMDLKATDPNAFKTLRDSYGTTVIYEIEKHKTENKYP